MGTSFSRAVLVVALTASSSCCSFFFPEDRMEGVLEAPTPLRAPISGREVCAIMMEVEYTYAGGGNLTRSHSKRSRTLFAPQAVFVTGGQRLLIAGGGGGYIRLPEQALWNTSKGPPPDGLRGWGPTHDESLDRALSSDPGHYRNIHFTERYVPCGQPTSLRGKVSGSQILLLQENLP